MARQLRVTDPTTDTIRDIEQRGSLIEMVEALEKVTLGIASEHTLFYGVEAKFYSARPKLTETFETEIAGLYCGGDGAGITRGLVQAGAAGVWIARGMMGKMGLK